MDTAVATVKQAPDERLGANGAPLRRPVVYLDWSTLSYAYVDSCAPVRNGLAELVCDVASRGTLCFSIVHLLELIAMPSREEAFARARYLDRLDHSWVKTNDAEREELAQAVRRELGLSSTPSCLPVHGTLSASVIDSLAKQTPGGVADILADPTIAGFVRKAHGRVPPDLAKRATLELFRLLHADRTNAPVGTTKAEIHERTFGKFVAALKSKAKEVISAEPVIIGEPRLADADVDAAVDRLLNDPDSLPMNRIVQHTWRRIGDRITDQRVDSNKFTARYGSILGDLRHLIAGGFADVFTCDRLVDRVLGDFRSQRRLPRQVSLGKHVGMTDFVGALRHQVDQVN
jgi:hypothetical protein